ncbi:hydrogenase iron-sulfur subunit [Candidatus Bathyarchaeota archaeon]|nr:hydrogenase iron-sulfur subunit [Candidatus Bathyarchaeota archaeon]
MVEFEPKIIAFLCNWCSYAGADLAGVSRIQYPPNIRVIRVMCSGRVDPVIVLEMFVNGTDGVMVMGCHPGECHYLEGNFYAERRIKMLKRLMACTGLEPERLRLEWVSASEGARFADVVRDFTNQIRRLGPSPLAGEKPDETVLACVRAAERAAAASRLRTLVGREKKLTEEENVYGEKVSQEEFDKLMEESVKEEYLRSRIYLLAEDRSLSVEELAEYLGVDSQIVLRHVVFMKRRGLLKMSRIEDDSPLYAALEVR